MSMLSRTRWTDERFDLFPTRRTWHEMIQTRVLGLLSSRSRSPSDDRRLYFPPRPLKSPEEALDFSLGTTRSVTRSRCST